MYLYKHFGRGALNVVMDTPAHTSQAAELLRNIGLKNVCTDVIRANLIRVEVQDGAAFIGGELVTDRLTFV